MMRLTVLDVPQLKNALEVPMIGIHVTFGTKKKRWRINDVGYAVPKDKKPDDPIRHYAFIGKGIEVNTECAVRIIPFTTADFSGEIRGEELMVYLNKEKDIIAWFPLPKEQLTITG